MTILASGCDLGGSLLRWRMLSGKRLLSSLKNREFCIAVPLGFFLCELSWLVAKSFLYVLICVAESILMQSVRTMQIRELLIPLRSLKREKEKDI